MSLRHAVLGLLADRPASGYDLMKRFETSLSHAWPATQSQVYGELGKLAKAGMLEVAAEGPRGRKEYAITDEGRAELRQWLTEAPPETVRRSDALLRVFFLDHLTPLEAVAYLTGEAERAAHRHRHLEEVNDRIEWDDDALSVNGRLAMEYGLRFTAMREEWARWAAEQISASGGR
ncbi:PadR family transcriptional regulator [Streptomyces eurocidicus]|uniref:PadR family transcriptional regulator n=1 Tax=Streptomyces eurocidicus TaxID=66423 RepID=A0A2N8NY16_STREU|nr:PadR family transcriptional regulator [Streptomyces eurocidicus]MBB5119768.1 DNA-binding PadR family transcriptional regulator [Streptomyces eurocidicus]MBF6050790.1 PadR family transcriptional regulator [Streptomyces eurocidicus]PNE33660.1 PadR family transcriptional regulator [Streptomyces eurocidicus]